MNFLTFGLFILVSYNLFLEGSSQPVFEQDVEPAVEINEVEPLVELIVTTNQVEGLSPELHSYMYDAGTPFPFEKLTKPILDEIMASEELLRRFLICFSSEFMECEEEGFFKISDNIENEHFVNGICDTCSPLATENQRNALKRFQTDKQALYIELLHYMNN